MSNTSHKKYALVTYLTVLIMILLAAGLVAIVALNA